MKRCTLMGDSFFIFLLPIDCSHLRAASVRKIYLLRSSGGSNAGRDGGCC